jgi:SWI/SNF-related matrix-associated actin-dependent regulator of chromatin subfamily A3
VSLVGQWISEAKSKLSDPGLIYQYHGMGRTRDPLILAKNSIVVTTYETLSSDHTYHRAKGADPSEYCPPCEHIRWWRIICDESHLLRSQSTAKSAAIMNLVADNKWLVSGELRLISTIQLLY